MARNLNHFLLRVHKKISIVDELRGTEMSLSRSSHSVSNITQLKPRLPYDLQRVARLSATAEQDWVYSLMEYRIRPTGGTDKVEGQPGLVGGNIHPSPEANIYSTCRVCTGICRTNIACHSMHSPK